MLTVKHIGKGYESVVSAESVAFYEKGLDEGFQVTMGRFVRALGTPRSGEHEDGYRDFFSEGCVYVMNENGKTVGSYDVSGSSREMKHREGDDPLF